MERTSVAREIEALCADNPLKCVEGLVHERGWRLYEVSNDMVRMAVPSLCGDGYLVDVCWREDMDSIDVVCLCGGFPPDDLLLLYETVGRINAQLLFSSFQVLDEEYLYALRLVIPRWSELTMSREELGDQVEAAVEQCDNYAPLFEKVLLERKSPRDALDEMIFETSGEA